MEKKLKAPLLIFPTTLKKITIHREFVHVDIILIFPYYMHLAYKCINITIQIR